MGKRHGETGGTKTLLITRQFYRLAVSRLAWVRHVYMLVTFPLLTVSKLVWVRHV